MTSNDLSLQFPSHDLNFHKVMGSNPGYLLKSFLLQQTNGKKWFEMFLCMNSIYAPTFRQISTKLAMRQLKIQKFQASFQLAQLEFFTTNVSKFLCVRARNVSSILSTFAVLLQNLLVKDPLISIFIQPQPFYRIVLYKVT